MNKFFNTAVGVAVGLSVWIGCISLWTVSMLMAATYSEFDAELPSLTLITLRFARNRILFVFAALCTVLLAYLAATQHKLMLPASLIILSVTLICLSLGFLR